MSAFGAEYGATARTVTLEEGDVDAQTKVPTSWEETQAQKESRLERYQEGAKGVRWQHGSVNGLITVVEYMLWLHYPWDLFWWAVGRQVQASQAICEIHLLAGGETV